MFITVNCFTVPINCLSFFSNLNLIPHINSIISISGKMHLCCAVGFCLVSGVTSLYRNSPHNYTKDIIIRFRYNSLNTLAESKYLIHA